MGLTVDGRMATGAVVGTAASAFANISKIFRDSGESAPVTAMFSSGNIVWGQDTKVYVGGTGASDSNSGTFTSPFATMAKAYEKVADHGTIFLKSDVLGALVASGKNVTIESCDENGAAYIDALSTDDTRIKAIKRNYAYSSAINVANATINLRNIKITDSVAGYSGHASVITSSGSVLNLNEGAVISGTSSPFGAIYMFDGTVNMNDGATICDNTNSGTFKEDNTIPGFGGGVTVAGDLAANLSATFNMNGGIIKNNSVANGYGGGIAVRKGTANICNNNEVNPIKITGNIAQNGGGIAIIDAGKCAVYSHPSKTASNDLSPKIINNTASTYGGGIYIADSTAELKLHDNSNDHLQIIDNTVGGYQNNIYLPTGVKITSAIINAASKVGVTTQAVPVGAGAVEIITAGNVGNSGYTLAAMLSDNPAFVTAEGAGVSIELKLNTNIYVGSTGKDTNPGTQTAPLKSLKCAYETVANNGTIHVLDTVTVTADDNIVVNGKTVTIKQASGCTGVLKREVVNGVVKNTGEIITIGANGVVNLTNVTVDGGAVYKNTDTTPENLVSGYFSKHWTGQLAWVNAGGTLNLETGAVLQNNAIVEKSFATSVILDHGSAIYVNGGNVNIKNGATITKNLLHGYAADGAAISMLYGDSAVTMTGGNITNNYGERMGSVIRLTRGTLNLSGGNITGNFGAAGASGAIGYYGGELNLGGNMTISGNKQGGNERNLYLDGTVPHISSALTGNVGITANRAAVGKKIANVFDTNDYSSKLFYDGKAFGVSADTTAKAVVLTAADKIYVGSNGADTNPGTYTQPYKTLAKAYSMAKANDTILIVDDMEDSKEFVLSDSKPIKITSSHTDGQPATDAQTHFTYKATGKGNHFTLRGNADVTVTNLTIKDNAAGGRAGRLFIANDGGAPNLTLGKGAVLTGGNSTFGGGSVYWNAGGTLTMLEGSVITDSKTTADAGAVYLLSGKFVMGGTISNSTVPSGYNAGAIYYGGGELELSKTAAFTNNTAGTATSNIFLTSGKVISVPATLDNNIGVSTTALTVPYGGKTPIATGVGAKAAKFTNDSVDTTNGFADGSGDNTVYLYKKSNDIRVSMNWLLPNETSVRGATSWTPDTMTIGITVPFEPVAGNLTLTTKPYSAKAKVNDNGTTAGIAAGGTVGAAVVTTIDLSTITTGAKHYFTVTAEDGTERQCTVTFTREEQIKLKTATFNFDGVKSNRQAATSKISFRGLPTTGVYTVKENGTEVTGLTAAVSAEGIVTLTASTAYCEAIDNGSTPETTWAVKAIGTTGIQVAAHERTVKLYRNGNEVGEFIAHTNNASATDLAVVLGLKGQLDTVSFLDAYQKAADAAGAAVGHPQKDGTTFPTIEDPAVSEQYVDTFVASAVEAYKATLGGSGEIWNALNNNKHKTFITNKKGFIAPIAGTADKPLGNNGQYNFTVTVACGSNTAGISGTPPIGGAAIESEEYQIDIIAHQFAGADTEDIKTKVDALTSPTATVYVDFGSTQDTINAAVLAGVNADLGTALTTLRTNLSATSVALQDGTSWTIQYNGGVNGAKENYSAKATINVVKGGETTAFPVSIPLTMTVTVRPDVNQAILDKLAADLLVGKTFADMTQLAAPDAASVIAKIDEQFKTHLTQVTGVTTSAAGETPATGDFNVTYSVAVTSANTGFIEALAGTAADKDGTNGQFLFDVEVTLTMGKTATNIAKKITFANPSAPTVLPSGTNANTPSDNGIYITATAFDGVTDIAVVDVVKAMFDNAAVPATHKLNYLKRNDADTRLKAVQAWVDSVVMDSTLVTVDGVVYAVENGTVKRQDGKGIAVDIKGTATAMLKGTALTKFADPSPAASSVDITDKYTVEIAKSTMFSAIKGRMMSKLAPITGVVTGNTNSAAIDVDHKFSHANGPITQPIVDPSGKSAGPYTMILQNTVTGELTTLRSNEDGILTIPTTTSDGLYNIGVRDSKNGYSGKSSIVLPATNATAVAITVSQGSLILGTVTVDGSKAAGATVSALGAASASVTAKSIGTQGTFILSNVKNNSRINVIADKDNVRGATLARTPTTDLVSITVSSGIMVIGGKVNQPAVGGDVAAAGTKVTITSPNGNKYIGFVDELGDFAVAGVSPTIGGTGFTLDFDDGRGQTAKAENVTVTPHSPAYGIATTTGITFPVKITDPNKGIITGVITGPAPGNTPISGATVELFRGNTKVASANSGSTGGFQFADITLGAYKLVATVSGEETTKNYVLTTKGSPCNIIVEAKGVGEKNTVVEQLGTTPPTTAEISKDIFAVDPMAPNTDDTKGVTQADMDIYNGGGTIEIKLTAEEKVNEEAKEDSEKINSAITSKDKIGMLLDFTVTKTVTANGSPTSVTTKLSEVALPIEIIVELSEQYQGKGDQLTIYRVHGNEPAKPMARIASTDTVGEGFSIITVGKRDYVRIIASRFSSYALIYTEKNSGGGSIGGGGDWEDDTDVTFPAPPPTKPVVTPTKPIAPPTKPTTNPPTNPGGNNGNEGSGGSTDGKGEEDKTTEPDKGKTKQELKTKLKEELDKAIGLLPKDLSENDRAEAIAKLTEIYNKAIAALDSADLSECDKIIGNAVEEMHKTLEAYKATNPGACTVCGRCTPFMGICLWIWLAIAAAAGILIFVVMKKKKSDKNSAN